MHVTSNNDFYYNHSITDVFGSNVFDDTTMAERLPITVYNSLKQTIDLGIPLKPDIAEVVANAMKDWAIEHGATHFTHWFQPMTGITAEKHDSFIYPTDNGKVIMEFSGKELIKGEPDASSFPSGGLRATFEARGYTTWDCTSPAFLKQDSSGVTLCIPTAFCSYNGQCLDKKTPLLRSMEEISRQSLRILRLFGNTAVTKVFPSVGPEQEYFLVDRDLYKKRKDLIFTGRTLFGAKPPKGQELEDHYFGSIKERVASFMKELDTELWKLGVLAKTKHNEVAPAQHELATIHSTANIATDHNQLVMETMKKIARRHNLVCLLHEKPFAGVNGSGKHNNWSLTTSDGQNLLEPGNTPSSNIQFLLFLCAIIKAVDEHADLLRMSAANAGNDHRLGGSEAPPAILSIFLGDELTTILEEIEKSEEHHYKDKSPISTGVATLPLFLKDSTDRNRTSPFAFTGNKFEFRMVPSSASISAPNFVLNTIVADSLCQIADKLEKSTNFNKDLRLILIDIIKKHKKIIFNGNNYSNEWVLEAQRRELPNITSSVDSYKSLIDEKNIRLFEKHNVLSKAELYSRYEISLENYIKNINIEVLTMLEMANKQIFPAVLKYQNILASSINNIKATNLDVDISANCERLNQVSEYFAEFSKKLKHLESIVEDANKPFESSFEKACYYRDFVCSGMNELRDLGDKLELCVDQDIWPFPTYEELLFNF